MYQQMSLVYCRGGFLAHLFGSKRHAFGVSQKFRFSLQIRLLSPRCAFKCITKLPSFSQIAFRRTTVFLSSKHVCTWIAEKYLFVRNTTVGIISFVCSKSKKAPNHVFWTYGINVKSNEVRNAPCLKYKCFFLSAKDTCTNCVNVVSYGTRKSFASEVIPYLDISYKNLSARANCSMFLLCALNRFFSSDVGTYLSSYKQTDSNKR